MAYIRVIGPDQAEGALAEAYENVKQKRGSIANVHAIHSLNPPTMQKHIDFYLSIMFGPSGLSRRERETIAVAVSHANQCSYCVEHHAAALARHQKDAGIVADLRTHGTSQGLTPREQVLVRFALDLTRRPGEITAADSQGLRDEGLGDEEILTATLTAAYFNFVNRVVLGLGVEMEGQEGKYLY